jgi:hypothetical protein
MFPPGSHTHVTINYYDPFNIDCSDWQACPMGLMDYKCQYNHSCYLNLIELAIYLLGYTIGAIFFIIIAGKLLSILYNVGTSILFVHRAITVITSILRCFSFGMLDRDVVVEVESGEKKKLSDKHYYIKKKLEDIDL